VCVCALAEEEDEMLMFQKILSGSFDFHEDPWSTISTEAKDLICGLIQVNPYKRMTVSQALRSPFIQRYTQYYQK